MRNLLISLLLALTIALPGRVSALLSMELTRGVAGAIPIAVVPFATQGVAPQDVSNIITNDLQNSGRFKVYSQSKDNIDYLVVGKVIALGGDRYQVSFQLKDGFKGTGGSVALAKSYTVSSKGLRPVAHRISDLVFQQITGIRGVFSTKLAYVVIQRGNGTSRRYILEVADSDGYNPRPLLSSPEPIMSPAWSPNGKYIAYVSFENRQAGIYLEDVANGSRRLLSQFPGINGAPAWSPDGKRLALVLSKEGSPDVYVMDVQSHHLTQVTHDFYINTEPAWSPNGRSLLYTSNRSGGPQIYEVNLATHATNRVTYDGDYNARPSFTQDGRKIAMIHRVDDTYNIAVLDLDTGTMRVLSDTAMDSASPSVAPNGSMILYDTIYGGRNVLAMVSADGRVQLHLPARNGEAQDPAWSPFLG